MNEAGTWQCFLTWHYQGEYMKQLSHGINFGRAKKFFSIEESLEIVVY